MAKLAQYLERIGFKGAPTVDIATLRAIHHHHLLNIPYENLDVQLGAPLDFDMDRIFDKLVHQRRGGWCYEMNGLLGWALNEIGFSVSRMVGGVMREERGDFQMGNHLVLDVETEGQHYLADCGMGDAIRCPIPIVAGSYEQEGLTYRLEHLEADLWRFHNHGQSNIASFDFRYAKADEALLATKCQWLQESPESPFKQVLIVQKFTPTTIEVLIGKRHTTITPAEKTTREIVTLDDMHAHLQTTFGLDVDISSIWAAIEEADRNFFGS